jgi:sugar lactone lactonase YvrE
MNSPCRKRLAAVFVLFPLIPQTLHPADARLAALVAPEARVEKVAIGFRFTEGPAWSPDGHLLFSDIPANRIVRIGPDGAPSDFLTDSGGANGLAFDARGNLYACLGGTRQVVRIARDGRRTVLASHFQGKRLNSPNDLALDDHGGLYFTDPRYGRTDDRELDVMGVYYISAAGELSRVIDSLRRPNGILVSACGKRLYVAEPDRRELHLFPIETPGKLGQGKVIFTGDAEADGGGPDGMVLDLEGNIYATYRSIVVLDPAGGLTGRIAVPEQPANCTFGGPDGRTLFITARTSLYKLETRVAGLPPRSTWGPRVEPLPRFVAQEIDGQVAIGYAVEIGDVDGDGRPDILLVDKRQVVWYRNPDWTRFVICENVTPEDNVCIAALDLDGDGKVEIAIGAGWNPGDTVSSGSVHYLLAPPDRTQRWEVVNLPHEPTVHRMRWALGPGGRHDLIVAPLHGRGNRGGEGAGVRVLAYIRPADPRSAWRTELADDALHVTHNLELVQWDADPEEEVLLAGREGVFLLDRSPEGWRREQLAGNEEGESAFRGASEIRTGKLPGGQRYLATIEPFHGHELVRYIPPAAGKRLWRRLVLDAGLRGGHAIACADIAGLGSDQLIAGWREKNDAGRVGINLYLARDTDGTEWSKVPIDDDGMACEDLKVADLDGDGRLEVIASGRATRNLKIYWNRRGEEVQ